MRTARHSSGVRCSGYDILLDEDEAELKSVLRNGMGIEARRAAERKTRGWMLAKLTTLGPVKLENVARKVERRGENRMGESIVHCQLGGSPSYLWFTLNYDTRDDAVEMESGQDRDKSFRLKRALPLHEWSWLHEPHKGDGLIWNQYRRHSASL